MITSAHKINYVHLGMKPLWFPGLNGLFKAVLVECAGVSVLAEIPGGLGN